MGISRPQKQMNMVGIDLVAVQREIFQPAAQLNVRRQECAQKIVVKIGVPLKGRGGDEIDGTLNVESFLWISMTFHHFPSINLAFIIIRTGGAGIEYFFQ